MASPEQCRPLPVEAEKARKILAKSESEGQLYGPEAVRHLASQPTVPGLDVRGELPPELEAHEMEDAPAAPADTPLETEVPHVDLRMPLALIPELGTPSSSTEQPMATPAVRERSRSPDRGNTSAGVEPYPSPDASRSRGLPVAEAVRKIESTARRLDLGETPSSVGTPAAVGPYRRASVKQPAVPVAPGAPSQEPPAKAPRMEDDLYAGAMHVQMADPDSEEDEWSDEDNFPNCNSDGETDDELPDEWCHLSREFVASPDHWL